MSSLVDEEEDWNGGPNAATWHVTVQDMATGGQVTSAEDVWKPEFLS
jgi:hypothetical protein